MPAMADWRQIQARIRKAKNSADARVKLSELYQRTHDAMVSWELGLVEEKAERIEEAIKWYTVSVERFRRSDWKKKAEEALTRLGAPIPVAGDKATEAPRIRATASDSTEEDKAVAAETREALAVGEIPAEEEDDDEEEGAAETTVAGAAVAEGVAGETDAAGKKKRRRGRRGGRGRRRKGAVVAGPGLPSEAFAAQKSAPAAPLAQTSTSMPPRFQPAPIPARTERFERRPSAYAAEHEAPSQASAEPFVPMLPSERTAHGRAGDPALASRMAKLDSMLRRLVASPLHKMDEADSAPAGPGVFLLSDSDQITSYYVEACQTLRVGLGNLVRGGGGRSNVKPMRGGRQVSESGLKAKLAEHLGIGEAKVSQYLKDHCVVRWIQLDDDAAHLAHFAIGVLRTPLNTD
jgi:hypothetical protein